jgi:hypothetical protein
MKKHMNYQTPPQVPDQKPLGCAPYAIGGASFIPLLGVPFGLVAIVWGLVKLKQGGWKVAILGAMGICFTVVLYSTLIYQGFVKRGGIYDELRGQMAEQMLVAVVKEIEFYKVQNGKYPESLKDVEPKGKPQGFVSIYDPSQMRLGNKELKLFHYALVNGGANYHLLSVGADGVPYTEDDVYPVLDESQLKSIGYLKPANNELNPTTIPAAGGSI